ncbi:MAG: ComF family protein [Opitutaceae bacterium]|nr:ComF family protein [Opitutaceae bacterium]
MKSAAARAWQGLADVIFPPVCVHCRAVVEAGEFPHLCVRCASKIEWVRAPHCTTCGHPFYGVVEGERLCPHCEGLQPAYREGRTAVLLKGPARALVHELKYHRGLYVLADIEAAFRRLDWLPDWLAGAVLVPVPLHPRKERERGYNQSRLMAECLQRATGDKAIISNILRRTEDTESQTFHDRKTRLANLKNAFALAPGAAITPAHHYLIVDDVFTTGSTLNSCARVLRRAGCVNLDVMTFGHG